MQRGNPLLDAEVGSISGHYIALRSGSMSVWERLGEKVGYGLATIVLGPHAALERRARRAMRTAMVQWVMAHRPSKREAPRGILRRTVSLQADAEPIDVDVEVDLHARRASLTFPITRLPSYVDVTVDKNAGAVMGARLRRTAPLASAGAFRLDGEALDRPTAQALVEAIAGGPFDRLEGIVITLQPERITIDVLAPVTRAEWDALGEGVVGVVAWLVARFPASYRG